jgi:homoprotocatechuate degradation regulator HpaR
MPKFRTIFKQFGITEQQARVVRILWQYKKVSFTELSSLTLISPPSLVGIVDRMAENDLVVRTISDIDRRIIIISLTNKGEVLESQIIPKVEAVYDEIESSMGTKDLNETLALLSKLSSIHEQKEIK